MNSLKTVFIIGATGLIGRKLVFELLSDGYKPIVLSRNQLKAKNLFNNRVEVRYWNGIDVDALHEQINGSKAIINLAGESIAFRWTKRRKELILKSRIDLTNSIVTAIELCSTSPEVFIQASAIGYYSHNCSLPTDENGTVGQGLLSDIVNQWEQSAKKIQKISRLVIIRTGVVLSNQGGFLSKVLTPIQYYIGGWFGNGSQIISWIHIKDHVRAICFLLGNNDCRGIYNLTSEKPTATKSLVKSAGVMLKRPIWLPVPSVILRLIFGRMADEVILSNQNIIPKRLIQAGFKFKFSIVDDALKDILVL